MPALVAKIRLARHDGGWDEVDGEVTKRGVVALLDPLDGGKGYVLALVATGRVLLRARLKGEARGAQKILDALDWADPEAHRATVEGLRKS